MGESPQEADRIIAEFFRSSGRTTGIGCPACDAAMVVRIRGRDGRPFLGCSRYPSCSGSWDIPACVQEESKKWERRVMSALHPEKERPTKMEKQTTEVTETAQLGIVARLKKSAAQAPYRVARMRALTEGKKALLAAIRPRVQPAAFDIIEAFLETDAGQGAVIAAIGIAGPMTPKFGKNKHVQSLCDEFLEEGMAKGANQLVGLLASIVEPAIAAAVASMPEISEVADKVVPKRRKRRVATGLPGTRVSGEAPPEEDDDVRERPLRAVASR